MPFTTTVPLGVGATQDFLRELHEVLGMEIPQSVNESNNSKLTWYSNSVDSNYLTGKESLFLEMELMLLRQQELLTRSLGLKLLV